MTCIVGIADGTSVWMGGDSCASSRTSRVEMLHPKVFKKSVPVADSDLTLPMLIGGSGAFRLMQLLEHGLEIPPMKKGQTLMKWLIIDFTDAVRDIFVNKGFGKISNNVETMEGDFLIGFQGQLFCMENTYQIIAVPEQEYATGSSYQYALGSMFTTRGCGLTPVQRIEWALQTAIKYDPSCAAPYNILSI